ncbi:hypothetical protein F4778DRAFT_781042 [Xylariomycetidae sp. FL2044]|nr:hypothetical protein F4778DRAFT_781042 [Xylariomycetidae sp. FL2044]
MVTSSTSAPADEVPTKGQVLRKLGNNEAYQLAMYTLDQYRGTAVSCQYLIPSTLTGPAHRATLIDTVQAAIADNVLKHPVLQVGITNADSSQPTFVYLDSLDLQQHIQWKFLDASVNFDAASQEQTMIQLDAHFPHPETQPGWNIILLCQENLLEIVFTWNHPHADGMSGKIFQQGLMRNLNGRIDMPQALNGHILKLPPPPLRLPPPVEQVADLPLGMKYLAKTLLNEGMPAVLLQRRPTLAHWAPITVTPYKTQFRSFSVEHDVLGKILAACKHHKTTLTGLFHALLLAILASLLPKETASGFQGGTTINIRPFVPSSPPGYAWLEPERTMGNFVTQVHHVFDPKLVASVRAKVLSSSPGTTDTEVPSELLDLIWDTAARTRSEISSKLKEGLRNDVVGTLKFVKDWRAQQKKAVQKPRQASWLITGLGVLGDESAASGPEPAAAVDDDEQSRAGGTTHTHTPTWRMTRAQFALSAEVPAAALMISPMTAANSQLCVGGSWQQCVVSTTLGERVMGDLELWLRKIGSR